MNRKKHTVYLKAVTIIMAIGLLSGLLTGCLLKKLLVDDHVMDGDGMINTAAPLLEMLSGDWESEDGRWRMTIGGHAMELTLDGVCVYDKGIDFGFDGEDTNVKTELSIYAQDNALVDESMNIKGTISEFYTENGLVYMNVAYPDGASENIIFNKAAEKIEVLDGERTYVDNEPLLAALQGVWASEDGLWRLEIDEYVLTIWSGDEQVYSETYYFVFYGGEDINDHTELELSHYELRKGDAECFAEIGYLFSENGMLNMLVTYRDGGDTVIIFKYLTTR